MNADSGHVSSKATVSQGLSEPYDASLESVNVPINGIEPVSAPMSTVRVPTTTNAPTELVASDGGDDGHAVPRRKVLFTSETASAAAKVRHAKAREAKLQRDKLVDESRFTARQRLGIALSELSLEDMRTLTRQLAKDAGAGDTKAIHALARLLDQSYGRAVPDVTPPVDDGELSYNAMTEAQRASYRAALMAEREAAKADAEPSSDTSDPRDTV